MVRSIKKNWKNTLKCAQSTFNNIYSADIKSCIELELELMKDMFNGDVQVWYADAIEAAEVEDLVDAPEN